MKLLLRIALPVLVLGAFAGIGGVLHLTQPQPEKLDLPPVVTPVEHITATLRDFPTYVKSQGTVQALTETALIPEVSGRILRVSPTFTNGGFFKEGEVLVEIDPIAYEAAVANAEASLAAARLALQQEIALSEQARTEWSELGRGEPSDLVLRLPQQAKARADIRAAEAMLRLAQQDLEDTRVRAPFGGRIRRKMADVGQVVSANMTTMATCYAIDSAEVSLPLSLDEITFLELPESYLGESGRRVGPRVLLTARYGSKTYQWNGVIDRTEGAIDSTTRLNYVVARVKDPYRRDPAQPGRPPLKVGLFVEATIAGKVLEEVFVIPRNAMVNEDTVYVISPENTLHRRKVSVYQSNTSWVVIDDGLEDGEWVNLTPIDFFIEGMPVAPAPLDWDGVDLAIDLEGASR